MVQYYPENTWDQVHLLDATNYHQRHLYAKKPQYWSASRRRRSISKSQHRQSQPPSPPLPPSTSQRYPWHYYFEDEQDIYEPPLSYWESHETMPDDLMLDDDYDYDYMDVAPGPRWSSFSSRPPQRRRSLASQYQQRHRPDNYHAWNDDSRNYNDDDDNIKYLADERIRPRQRRLPTKDYHSIDTRRRRSLGAPPLQSTWDSDYGVYSDEEDEEEDNNNIYLHHLQHQEKTQHISRRHSMQQYQQQQRQYHGDRHHHQHRTSTTTPWIRSPVMGSPESNNITSSSHTSSVLHQPSRLVRMEQGPSLLSIDTQQQQQQQPLPTSFYGQASQPPILPMPQPMMPPPPPLSFLPPQFNYGFPTMPTIMPAPFNPVIMPQPHYLTEKSAITSSASPTIAPPAPPLPSSDDAKSPSSAPDLTTTTSTATTTPPVTNNNTATTTGENSLVPLARSLSLGTSQPLRTKPGRRRSLFGSLFASATTTTTDKPLSATSSVTSSPSLIPVHELTKNSLTRKQSLSLEKKAKALSQRSYIWCYRIKPSLTTQQQQQQQQPLPNGNAWMAMTPKNQTKLDPYLCFYQPNAVVKALIRTENLPTLVTLDKEPELTGSITVMPQAKIARVYPSMFSSSNYIELIIDCLPADSQFVVRSD